MLPTWKKFPKLPDQCRSVWKGWGGDSHYFWANMATLRAADTTKLALNTLPWLVEAVHPKAAQERLIFASPQHVKSSCSALLCTELLQLDTLQYPVYLSSVLQSYLCTSPQSKYSQHLKLGTVLSGDWEKTEASTLFYWSHSTKTKHSSNNFKNHEEITIFEEAIPCIEIQHQLTSFLSCAGTWLKYSQACQNKIFSSLNSFRRNS